MEIFLGPEPVVVGLRYFGLFIVQQQLNTPIQYQYCSMLTPILSTN